MCARITVIWAFLFIDKNMVKKFTQEQEALITKLYIEGEKSTILAKKYKCHYVTILNVVKRNGGKIKNYSESHRKIYCNDNYFNKIDTQNKAYFLGLLYADGCVHSTQPRFLISLQEEDSYILENFKEDLQYNGKLYYRPSKNIKHKNQVCLEVTSIILKNNLIKLGCIPSKSLSLTFPTEDQVPHHLLNHFIRGYFDGDGSVGKSIRNINNRKYTENFVQFVGSCSFIEGLSNKLNFLKSFNISLINSGKNKNLSIKSKFDIISMYEYLYKDKCCFLTRKYQIFKRVTIHLKNKPYFYSNNAISQYNIKKEFIKNWENLDNLIENIPKLRRDCVLKCIKGELKTTGGFVFKIT